MQLSVQDSDTRAPGVPIAISRLDPHAASMPVERAVSRARARCRRLRRRTAEGSRALRWRWSHHGGCTGRQRICSRGSSWAMPRSQSDRRTK